MTVVSTIAISEAAGTAQLADAITGNGTLTYNLASNRVTIPELTEVISYSSEDFKAHLASLVNWKQEVSRVLNPTLGALVDHKCDIETNVGDDEVEIKVTIGSVEVEARYVYSTNAITFQPHSTLDISWLSFVEYVGMLLLYYDAIKLLKSTKP